MTAPPPCSAFSMPSSPAPWCCTATCRPSTPSVRSSCTISADVSDSATQSGTRPAAWSAPRALGPRATIRVCARASTRSWPRPDASAVSNQPRNPMPVVTTSTSGGSATSSRVAASRPASSRWDSTPSADAVVTSAPRRCRAPDSSSARRWAVTSTVVPDRTGRRTFTITQSAGRRRAPHRRRRRRCRCRGPRRGRRGSVRCAGRRPACAAARRRSRRRRASPPGRAR